MSRPSVSDGVITAFLSLGVNVVLAAAKLSVGFIASSQALIADGVHSLVDLVTDVAAYVGLKYSDLPKD